MPFEGQWKKINSRYRFWVHFLLHEYLRKNLSVFSTCFLFRVPRAVHSNLFFCLFAGEPKNEWNAGNYVHWGEFRWKFRKETCAYGEGGFANARHWGHFFRWRVTFYWSILFCLTKSFCLQSRLLFDTCQEQLIWETHILQASSWDFPLFFHCQMQTASFLWDPGQWQAAWIFVPGLRRLPRHYRETFLRFLDKCPRHS